MEGNLKSPQIPYTSEKIEVYYKLITGEFNIAPFLGNVSSGNDVNTKEILDHYLDRFEDAWEELSRK